MTDDYNMSPILELNPSVPVIEISSVIDKSAIQEHCMTDADHVPWPDYYVCLRTIQNLETGGIVHGICTYCYTNAEKKVCFYCKVEYKQVKMVKYDNLSLFTPCCIVPISFKDLSLHLESCST